MPTITQQFDSAPMDGRVVRMSALAIVVVLLVVLVESGLAVQTYNRHGGSITKLWPAAVAALIAISVIVGKFLYDRSLTARFRIEDNILVLGKKRYPLEGLTNIARDPKVMCWALKVRGNGGLGSIRGRFWSKRMGKFDAFLTGTENAVVLTWPASKVTVSPADPEFFIHIVRKAAELP